MTERGTLDQARELREQIVALLARLDHTEAVIRAAGSEPAGRLEGMTPEERNQWLADIRTSVAEASA